MEKQKDFQRYWDDNGQCRILHPAVDYDQTFNTDSTLEGNIPTIKDLGKYQGNPLFIPYFWESAVLQEQADEEFEHDGTTYYIVNINPDDAHNWWELRSISHLLMWESDNGFIHSLSFNTIAELRTAQNEITNTTVAEAQGG